MVMEIPLPPVGTRRHHDANIVGYLDDLGCAAGLVARVSNPTWWVITPFKPYGSALPKLVITQCCWVVHRRWWDINHITIHNRRYIGYNCQLPSITIYNHG